MATDPVVVVGGGIGGHAAAVALGDAGTEVVLLDASPHLPYDRPPLSKHVLTGGGDASSVTLTPDDWWAAHHVQVVTGARVVDIGDHRATTATGDTYPWSSLILATGAAPRLLPIAGAELTGVRCVNDLDGALACAATIDAVEQVVIIGAGFIGCEAAAALRRVGKRVTLVDAAPRPLGHAVGETIADWFTAVHRDEGVELRFGLGIEAFVGDDHVRGVRCTSGEVLDADLVIVAVGVVLQLDLARAAGCVIDDGVVVDPYLRTSRDGVFAIGDIASVPSRFVDASAERTPARYRSEHYNVAVAHGTAVANTLLGDGVPFDALPTFWTDQYDVTVNGAGPTERADDMVVRGSLDDRDFLALYFTAGRLRAGLACGQRREYRALRKLLERGDLVHRDAVADPAVPLASL